MLKPLRRFTQEGLPSQVLVVSAQPVSLIKQAQNVSPSVVTGRGISQNAARILVSGHVAWVKLVQRLMNSGVRVFMRGTPGYVGWIAARILVSQRQMLLLEDHHPLISAQ